MINELIVSTFISSFMNEESLSIKLLLELDTVCHGSYSHGTFRLVAVNCPLFLSKNIDIVGFCYLSFFLWAVGMETRAIIYTVFSLLSLEPTEWKDASVCVCVCVCVRAH